MEPTADTFERALLGIQGKGFAALEEFYRQSAHNLSRAAPRLPARDRPLVYLCVDFRGWCGERISRDMAARMPRLDCRIVRLGDREHLRLDGDLYVYRNICWAQGVQLPPWFFDKVVCLLESTRALTEGLKGVVVEDYRRVLGVVPLNRELEALLLDKTGVACEPPLPNGVDTSAFRPAPSLPAEFVVGAAGNFSLDWYDEWKGFSRYVVPACKRAGVRLKWCGWKGEAAVAKLRGEQVPMGDMPAWYRGLSCLVSMSKSEACSSVIFEAQASGVPVVSTGVGWHREACGADDGVVWVGRPEVQTPAADEACVEALARTLVALKRDRARSARVGAQGRAFACRWSWDVLAPRWEALLLDMVERARSGSRVVAA